MVTLVSAATQPGQLVVERIRDAGPISRVEVARSTGLAPATVNRWAARMLDSGLLRTSGSDLGTGGRPSTLLRLNARFGVTLAVDVADRHIDIARLDLVGHMIDNTRIESDSELGEPRLQEVLDEIAAAIATDPSQPVLAIGVSVPGPVDRDGVVLFAPALEWNDVPLGRLLAERTGEVFDGVVVGSRTTKDGTALVEVHVPEPAVVVWAAGRAPVGEPVRIRLRSAEPETGTLLFDVVA